MGLKEAARALTNGTSDNPEELSEVIRSQMWELDHLRENFTKLEAQMIDEGWRKVGAQFRREFTRDGLDDIMSVARAMYLSHPLIKRAVNVTAYYTWAQGVTVNAEDERIQADVITPMMDDHGNRAELYSGQARMLTDIDQSCDGNIFIGLPTDDRSGEVGVRAVPAEEIRQIIKNPDDRSEVWYYKRAFVQQEFDVSTGTLTDKNVIEYHPDVNYNPIKQQGQIGGHEVRWDAPIIHQKTGGLKLMQFGVPEVYAAIDWARAYKKFLEDWHTIVASLAKFAWERTTKGNKQKARTKLERGPDDSPADPETGRGGRGWEAGSVWLGGEEGELKPIPKTGATTSAEDAKPSRMMIASATDLPDTILSGDPQQGNLATAKTLDRPTELAFVMRQSMWADLDKSIFAYRLRMGVQYGPLPGKVRRVNGSWEVTPSFPDGIEITFPPILEHDMGETVNALVAAATLSGKTEAGTMPRDVLSKLLMQAVGVDDIEQALKELGDEDKQAVADAVRQARQQLNKPQPDPNADPEADPAKPPKEGA